MLLQGHPNLVQILSKHFSPLIGHDLNPNKNVLITVGAYGSLFCAIQAFVEAGDEVSFLFP